jgi:hypothetical protein
LCVRVFDEKTVEVAFFVIVTPLCVLDTIRINVEFTFEPDKVV